MTFQGVKGHAGVKGYQKKESIHLRGQKSEGKNDVLKILRGEIRVVYGDDYKGGP